MSKVWFITGCSSGFGLMLAEKLCKRGDQVAATARRMEPLEDLKSRYQDNLAIELLDVSRGTQIDEAVSAALERFGRVDVLVNNAGYGYFATQEEGCVDEIRRMFETNVVGLIRITQKLLPTMREQRSGTIINMSSIAGRVAFPRSGFYNASKWAVEALSESLFYEVGPFGIRIVVIEPGAYATDFAPRSAVRSPKLTDADSPYADLAQRWTDAAAEMMPDRQDPAEVVDGIIRAADGTEPFVRIPFGKDATQLVAQREGRTDAEFIQTMARRYMDM